MRIGKILDLVRRNIARSRKHFLLSTIGIVIGIASLTFFLALSDGVSRVLLGDVFPVDQLQVVPPRSNLAALGLTRPLDDEVVAALRRRPEVRTAFPRMKLAFPARAWGAESLFGRTVRTELVADGIDPQLAEGTFSSPYPFRDLEADEQHAPCAQDSNCPTGQYCAWDLHTCQKPVPTLLSRYLVELYNGTIAVSHPRFPKIRDFVLQRLYGITMEGELGRSFTDVARTPTANQGLFHRRRFQFVGISERAIPIGATVPIGYIRRWNQIYAGEREAKQYSSISVQVRSKRDVTRLTVYIRDALGFEVAESGAQQVGLIITIVTLLFGFISVVIIGIAAINIAHTFFMVVAERRREIGVMRAVGATRANIRALILAEAGAIGLVGGSAGIAIAYALSRVVDVASRRLLPDFPFKPTTYFEFGWGLVLGGLLFGVVFCILGAYVPAERAAKMGPAAALSAQ